MRVLRLILLTLVGISVAGRATNASLASAAGNSWQCSTDDASAGCSSKLLHAVPTPTDFAAAVTGSNGLVYTLGGQDAFFQTYGMEAYNPNSNSWNCQSTGDPDAFSLCASWTLAPMPSERAHIAAARGANGVIYTMDGGNGGPTSASRCRLAP